MSKLNKELTVLAVITIVTALSIAQLHKTGDKAINEKGRQKANNIVLLLPLPCSATLR